MKKRVSGWRGQDEEEEAGEGGGEKMVTISYGAREEGGGTG